MQQHKQAFDHAKELIKNGKVVKDEKDAWSQDAPTTDDENAFIEDHNLQEYGKWYLAIEGDKDNKTSYKFPYGDFEKVHRGAVIAAKVRAAQYDHQDIEKEANELLKMIDDG